MTSKEAKCSISAGGASYNGSEQHADRPAVVVSNNKNNENSSGQIHCTSRILHHGKRVPF